MRYQPTGGRPVCVISRLARGQCAPSADWREASVHHQPTGGRPVRAISRLAGGQCASSADWREVSVRHQPTGGRPVCDISRLAGGQCAPSAYWREAGVRHQRTGGRPVCDISRLAGGQCATSVDWREASVRRSRRRQSEARRYGRGAGQLTHMLSASDAGCDVGQRLRGRRRAPPALFRAAGESETGRPGRVSGPPRRPERAPSDLVSERTAPIEGRTG